MQPGYALLSLGDETYFRARSVTEVKMPRPEGRARLANQSAPAWLATRGGLRTWSRHVGWASRKAMNFAVL